MLTNKELMLIQDNIKMSSNMVSLLSACAQSTTDAQLKNLCQTMSTDHQKDIQILSSYITNTNLQ